MPAVYGLDVTDVSRWEETVLDPALQIVDSLSKVGPQQDTVFVPFPLHCHALFNCVFPFCCPPAAFPLHRFTCLVHQRLVPSHVLISSCLLGFLLLLSFFSSPFHPVCHMSHFPQFLSSSLLRLPSSHLPVFPLILPLCFHTVLHFFASFVQLHLNKPFHLLSSFPSSSLIFSCSFSVFVSLTSFQNPLLLFPLLIVYWSLFFIQLTCLWCCF